jgi:predicted TIM-barrel enzyme
LKELLSVADGIVVGSALRANGLPGGMLDSVATDAFAKAFHAAC